MKVGSLIKTLDGKFAIISKFYGRDAEYTYIDPRSHLRWTIERKPIELLTLVPMTPQMEDIVAHAKVVLSHESEYQKKFFDLYRTGELE